MKSAFSEFGLGPMVEIICLVDITGAIHHIININRAKKLVDKLRVSGTVLINVMINGGIEQEWAGKNGLADTPKTTLLNLSVVTSGTFLNGSFTQRNRNASLSSLAMDIIKNAFSMSPVSVTACTRNHNMMSNMYCPKGGPMYRQSFSEAPVVLADAS